MLCLSGREIEPCSSQITKKKRKSSQACICELIYEYRTERDRKNLRIYCSEPANMDDTRHFSFFLCLIIQRFVKEEENEEKKKTFDSILTNGTKYKICANAKIHGQRKLQ